MPPGTAIVTGVGAAEAACSAAKVASTRSSAAPSSEDVENLPFTLIQVADDVKKAETGIIYIDEVDKISRKSENPSITRDVSGEGVRQALRRTTASVPPQGGRKDLHQGFVQIDTTNVLFIVGGAFAGFKEIRRKAVAIFACDASICARTITNWSDTCLTRPRADPNLPANGLTTLRCMQ